jgi:hypothetical protein
MKKFLLIAFASVLLFSGSSMVSMSQEEELPPPNSYDAVSLEGEKITNVTWA